MFSLPCQGCEPKYKEINKGSQSWQKLELSSHHNILNTGLMPCIIKATLILCFPLCFVFFYSLLSSSHRPFKTWGFSLQQWEGILRDRLCSLSTLTALPLPCKVVEHSWVVKQEMDELCPAMQISPGYMGSRKKGKAWKHAVNSYPVTIHEDRRVLFESPQPTYHCRGLNTSLFLTKQSYRSEIGETLQPESLSFVT